MPGTVIVRVSGDAVALADIFAHTLENQYCWDCEYYLVLRVREVLDPTVWAGLPWGQLGAGDVTVVSPTFEAVPVVFLDLCRANAWAEPVMV